MAAFRFFRHRLRTVLLIFLFVNLALTVVRQVFDFMGYVWTPIGVNFLNIIFTIFAIFAAAQLRSPFFIVYICWSPFWLAWNSFLVCYYFNIGALNRDDARPLSWGTGGRSWWSQNTPGCQRIYNATSATVEIGDCKFLRPFHVEIIESIVHIALTVSILVMVITFIFVFPRKMIGEPYASLPRRRSTPNRPHVTVEIGPTPSSNSVANELENNAQTIIGNAADTSFNRSSDISSGYLNVSYDASPAAPKINCEPIIANGGGINRPPPPQPLQNYRRNSQKRRSNSGGTGNGSVQRRTREKSKERQNNHDLPISDQNQPAQQISESVRISAPRQSQRLSRPVQGLGDLLVEQAVSRPTAVAETKSSSPKQAEHRRQPIVRTYHRRDAEADDTSPVVDYSIEPRRVGAAKAMNGSQQVPTEPFKLSNPGRRSVISFDPKSDGDNLLRFHDHLARSQETILSRASTSTQQPPQLLTSPDVVSFDSGLPASHGGGSDDDPRFSRDSQTLSGPGFTRQQQPSRNPIGYEPAFMMSYEPASSQDEPIYRPSFLRSNGSGQSPIKFRYDDDSVKIPSKIPPSAARLNDADYIKPNSFMRVERTELPNGKDRNRTMNGHDAMSIGSSGSETSSVAGLAVPRISNSSLLV